MPFLSTTISHCGSLLGIRYLGWYIVAYKVQTGKLDAKTETFEALEVLIRSLLELKKYANSYGMAIEYPAMH